MLTYHTGFFVPKLQVYSGSEVFMLKSMYVEVVPGEDFMSKPVPYKDLDCYYDKVFHVCVFKKKIFLQLRKGYVYKCVEDGSPVNYLVVGEEEDNVYYLVSYSGRLSYCDYGSVEHLNPIQCNVLNELDVDLKPFAEGAAKYPTKPSDEGLKLKLINYISDLEREVSFLRVEALCTTRTSRQSELFTRMNTLRAVIVPLSALVEEEE